MDPQFLFQIQSPSLSGGAEASSAVNEAYINGVYAGLNFRSLITHGSFDPAADAHNVLSMPIAEKLFTTNDAVLPAEDPPFNFFSESETFPSHHREKLPNLLSLEIAARSESSFPLNHRFGNVKAQALQRRRQQRVSEKTRRLQKLLPCDKKMDTAKVLEETYKYIKFLEAQASVLQSMPNDDCEIGGNRSTTTTESGGDLGSLNRQQLLQVVVNSPATQQLLYSNGCCVYSVEQMVLLKKNAQRNALFHQILYGSNPSS